MTISQSTCETWLKIHHNDTAICPHKSDSCPYCFQMNQIITLLNQQVALHLSNQNLDKVQTLKVKLVEIEAGGLQCHILQVSFTSVCSLTV